MQAVAPNVTWISHLPQRVESSIARRAFIGTGSAVFARHLLGDMLSFPELVESGIALMDIDPEWMSMMATLKGTRVGPADVNHPSLTRLERHGEDLHPLLIRTMECPNRVIMIACVFELSRRLGCFGAESSEHTAEYVPYSIRTDKRRDMLARG